MIARSLLALLAAFWFSAAAATDTVIYQPQTRDSVVTAEQWGRMFRSLRSEGVTTLLVQWTRYGSETFGGRGGWLEKVLQQAVDEDLGLIVGLHWDPAFFSWAGENPPTLASHLRTYVGENLAAADQWRDLAARGKVRGWYLPAELDDLNWQSADKRALLAESLEQLRSGLEGTGPKLFLSAFFGGHTPPREYAAWLRSVAEGGWYVWVQDGSGTGALTADQRRSYLEALFPCPAAGLGLVVEAFRQTSAREEAFRARPAMAKELEGTRRAYRNLCPDRQAVFSLRYLPVARGIMAYE